MKTKITTFIALLLTATSCLPDNWRDDPDPGDVFWTDILDVSVMPDTIALGDTVTVRVKIKDSLAIGVQYYWNFSSERVLTNLPVVRTTFSFPDEYLSFIFPTDTAIYRQWAYVEAPTPSNRKGSTPSLNFTIKIKKK
jgi:hypothetical protein